MANKRRGAYSPSMNMPGSGTKRSGRGMFAILLTFALPPLGLMFLWRKGVFRLRGRVLLSVLATVEMAVLMAAMAPVSTVSTVQPMPGPAERYVPAPESEVLTALSNMDEILRQQQAAEGGDDDVVLIDQQQQLARQQEVLNTIVYAYNGAGTRYYHSVTVCGNQSNLLTLTVQEALAKGLGPCPDCDPPSYTQLASVQ